MAGTLALKVFKVRRKSDAAKVHKAVCREAILWCQLEHENVLPFYGVNHLRDHYNRVCIVSPWMEDGDIVAYLKGHPSANRQPFLFDIVSGLSYLHDNDIFHGDLKGSNILVSPGPRACLADFGLSRISSSGLLQWTSEQTTGPQAGTIAFQAPEIFMMAEEKLQVSSKSDMYSYGCVCYEIMTGKMPFYELKTPYAVMFHVKQGRRPKKPSPHDTAFQQFGLTEPLWGAIQDFWEQEPENRPTAKETTVNPLFAHVALERPKNGTGFSASQFRQSVMLEQLASGFPEDTNGSNPFLEDAGTFFEEDDPAWFYPCLPTPEGQAPGPQADWSRSADDAERFMERANAEPHMSTLVCERQGPEEEENGPAWFYPSSGLYTPNPGH